MRKLILFGIFFPLVLLSSSSAYCGYFDRLYTSSRVQAMGGAFAGIADDPAAILINPAGLTSIPGFSFVSTISRPYGLNDLKESFIGVVFPVWLGKAGISWHRLSLEGVTSEDLLTIAFCKDYIRTSQDASLSFGGTIDAAIVSYRIPYETSKTVFSGSLGALLRPFPIIGIGYSIRNIASGEFDFDRLGQGQRLRKVQRWSLAYHWQNRVSVIYERTTGPEKKWDNRFGVEVKVLPGLRFRSGMNQDFVGGGVGLCISNLVLDTSVTSHEAMGLSYILTFGYSFGKGQ